MTKRDQYGRYEWDEEVFAQKHEERLKKEKEEKEAKLAAKEESKHLKNLVTRTDFVDLARGINKRKVIGEDVPLDKIGHYSCPVCQLYFRDSYRYLRHLNSPEHNAKLGMSMKVAETTDEDVLNRIQQWENYYEKGIEVPPIYREEIASEIAYDE